MVDGPRRLHARGHPGLDDFRAPERAERTTLRHNVPKVGRNDLCPCGSGRKYKKCCGAPDKLN